MFDKLKSLYVTVFYSLCLYVIACVKKVMLHLINFQGLDPNRDVEFEQRKVLMSQLSECFSECPKRSVAKIPVNIAAGKYDVKHRAFKIKHTFGYGSVPDFSEVQCKFVSEPKENSLYVVKSVEPEVIPPLVVESVPETTSDEVILEVAEEDILEILDVPEEVPVVLEEAVEPVKMVKKRKPRVMKSPTKKPVKKTRKK